MKRRPHLGERELATLPASPVPGLGLGIPRWSQLRALPALVGSARASREGVVASQRNALGHLLRFAGSNVAYYRDVFAKHDLDPERIGDPFEALRTLPLLNRMELMHEPPERMMPKGRDRSRLVPERSSGSTGTKLLLWREPFETHLLQLFRWRMWRSWGVGWRSRVANIRGVFRANRRPLPITRLRDRLGLFHTRRFSLQESPKDLLEQLVAFDPDLLASYPSVCHRLALTALEAGDRRLRPRVVTAGGETINDEIREACREAFGVPLRESYGAMEFNLLAWRCAESGYYHICDDAVHLDVVADGRPVAEGELGEVVATGLHSYTFPLIRYRLGDLAVRGPDQCSCGAPFSTLREIKGRTVEYYLATSGRPVHHWTVKNAVLDPLRLKRYQYQIEQAAADHLIIRVVPMHPITPEEIEAAEARARELLGEDMRCELRIVDHLPIAPSGKMIQSINRISGPWRGSNFDPASWDAWNHGSAPESTKAEEG